MVIQIDTREKQRAIKQIKGYFDTHSIKYISSKLYVGDYMNLDNPKLIIDRKQNLFELAGNLCQQHKRFTTELIRAKDAGIHIIILCEHGGKIRTLEDVKEWQNPRLYEHPLAMSGERMYKVMRTMQSSNKYSVEFRFCDKWNTGKQIVEILSGGS